MASRWLAFCRALAPASMRERAFDPAAHDVRQAGLGSRRAAHRLRETLALLLLALECRRLALTAAWRADANSPRHGRGLMEPLVLAARHAVRRLLRQPLFAVVAIATLGLGIGANLAVFSYVNAFVLAPLPVPGGSDLVRVYGFIRRGERLSLFDVLTYPNYRDARDGAAGLDLAAHVATDVLATTGADSGDTRGLELVTGNYFRVLGLRPVAGRLIDPSDDGAEGAHPVVVLGDAYWHAAFGAAPDVVGRRMRLNGASFEIVGVAPAGFRGADASTPADLWAPVTMQRVLRPRGPTNTLENRGWGWLRSIGRLAPGVTIATAQARLDAVAADIRRRIGPQAGDVAFTVTAATALEADARAALAPYVTATLAFTALLLLVTCANLGGLMRARSAARQREMAIRRSLGARWRDLAIEWVAESAVLAAGGLAAGVGLSRLAIGALLRFRPPAAFVGRVDLSAPLDASVLLFGTSLAALALMLVALGPLVGARRLAPVDTLKEEGATSTGGRRGSRMRRLAVVVQIGGAAALLVACGLLVTSLQRLRTYDTGFDTSHLALATIDLRTPKLSDPEIGAYRTALLERVRARPDVAAADLIAYLPLQGGRDREGFAIPGYVPPDGKQGISIDENIVGAGYFAALGLHFVDGRSWDPSGSPPGVVVNESMARRYWPGRSAVGQSIALAGGPAMTVTGVVVDSAYYSVGEAPMPYVFLPAELANPPRYTLVVRTPGDPTAIVADLQATVTAIDRRVTPREVTTFEAKREAPLYPRKMLASAASVLGLVGVVLSGIGLFGVVSTSVAQRTREIGIRMALGARTLDVQAGVLRDAVMLALVGAVAGLGGGYLLAGALKSWLFGVSAFSPLLYLAVATVLALVALAAAWIPARRASSIDPVVALRQ